MNREIKFRAWGTESKEWLYDFWINPENGKAEWIDCQSGGTFTYENNIVMQYTGLKDKNGTEIYEGDVICPHGDRHPDDCGVYHEHIEKPYYDKSAWHEQVKWDQKNALWNLPRDEDSNLSFPEFWIVIGNIWENPELIDK